MEISDTKQTLLWLWIIAALAILLMLLLAESGLAQAPDFYSDLSRKERELARKMEEKYLDSRHGSPLRFKGDARIDEDEYVQGNVVILDGTLEIEGEVGGNVLAIFGDVELESTAYVEGDVISVNGKVWVDEDAVVNGDIVETGTAARRRHHAMAHHRNSTEERTYIKKRRVTKKPRSKHEEERNYFYDDADHSSLFASYNRVDGLTLGFRLPHHGWWERRRHNFAIFGKGGYSFASERMQYQLGIERWFLGEYRFSFGGEIHNLTDTQDGWIIGNLENSLAAAIIKEDFQDYYRRQGYSLFLSQNLGHKLNLRAEYHDDDFENLENRAKWSLFGKKKTFRPNPAALPVLPLEPGSLYLNKEFYNIRSLSGTLTIDSRDSKKRPSRGWYITAFAEKADEELMQSDFYFERYILDIRRYQPLGWDENLNIRLRAGTSTGTLPPMYWFDLGGISTLRGYDFKEFTGDRMVLANVEYHLNTNDVDWFLLDSFDLVLFVDGGYAWFADENTPTTMNYWPIDETYRGEALRTTPESGFERLSWNKIKTDVGIALVSHDDYFRINFAKRMDRNFGDRDIVITFRIRQPF